MAYDRRQFIACTGAAVAALLGLPAALRAGRPPAGAQLYTLRTLLATAFESTLAALAGLGIREVEFAGYHDHDPARVRAVLETQGLVAPSAHISWGQLTGPDREWAFAAAHAVGHRWITVPWLPAQDRGSADAWRRTAARLTEIGDAARGAGLRLAYHNHDFELTGPAGATGLDLLMDHTDPALVSFQLDVYWLARAGEDPVEWLHRRADRVSMLHLKDTGGPPDHVMCDVGAGTLDFRAILAAADTAGVRHAFIEHDRPSDPMATIRNGLGHLARLSL